MAKLSLNAEFFLGTTHEENISTEEKARKLSIQIQTQWTTRWVVLNAVLYTRDTFQQSIFQLNNKLYFYFSILTQGVGQI